VCDKRTQQSALWNEANDPHPLEPKPERHRLARPLENRPRPTLAAGKRTSEAIESAELDVRLGTNDPTLSSNRQGRRPEITLQQPAQSFRDRTGDHGLQGTILPKSHWMMAVTQVASTRAMRGVGQEPTREP
jgi:hypothetical protein